MRQDNIRRTNSRRRRALAAMLGFALPAMLLTSRALMAQEPSPPGQQPVPPPLEAPAPEEDRSFVLPDDLVQFESAIIKIEDSREPVIDDLLHRRAMIRRHGAETMDGPQWDFAPFLPQTHEKFEPEKTVWLLWDQGIMVSDPRGDIDEEVWSQKRQQVTGRHPDNCWKKQLQRLEDELGGKPYGEATAEAWAKGLTKYAFKEWGEETSKCVDGFTEKIGSYTATGLSINTDPSQRIRLDENYNPGLAHFTQHWNVFLNQIDPLDGGTPTAASLKLAEDSLKASTAELRKSAPTAPMGDDSSFIGALGKPLRAIRLAQEHKERLASAPPPLADAFKAHITAAVVAQHGLMDAASATNEDAVKSSLAILRESMKKAEDTFTEVIILQTIIQEAPAWLDSAVHHFETRLKDLFPDRLIEELRLVHLADRLESAVSTWDTNMGIVSFSLRDGEIKQTTYGGREVRAASGVAAGAGDVPANSKPRRVDRVAAKGMLNEKLSQMLRTDPHFIVDESSFLNDEDTGIGANSASPRKVVTQNVLTNWLGQLERKAKGTPEASRSPGRTLKVLGHSLELSGRLTLTADGDPQNGKGNIRELLIVATDVSFDKSLSIEICDRCSLFILAHHINGNDEQISVLMQKTPVSGDSTTQTPTPVETPLPPTTEAPSLPTTEASATATPTPPSRPSAYIYSSRWLKAPAFMTIVGDGDFIFLPANKNTSLSESWMILAEEDDEIRKIIADHWVAMNNYFIGEIEDPEKTPVIKRRAYMEARRVPCPRVEVDETKIDNFKDVLNIEMKRLFSERIEILPDPETERRIPTLIGDNTDALYHLPDTISVQNANPGQLGTVACASDNGTCKVTVSLSLKTSDYAVSRLKRVVPLIFPGVEPTNLEGYAATLSSSQEELGRYPVEIKATTSEIVLTVEDLLNLWEDLLATDLPRHRQPMLKIEVEKSGDTTKSVGTYDLPLYLARIDVGDAKAEAGVTEPCLKWNKSNSGIVSKCDYDIYLRDLVALDEFGRIFHRVPRRYIASGSKAEIDFPRPAEAIADDFLRIYSRDSFHELFVSEPESPETQPPFDFSSVVVEYLEDVRFPVWARSDDTPSWAQIYQGSPIDLEKSTLTIYGCKGEDCTVDRTVNLNDFNEDNSIYYKKKPNYRAKLEFRVRPKIEGIASEEETPEITINYRPSEGEPLLIRRMAFESDIKKGVKAIFDSQKLKLPI